MRSQMWNAGSAGCSLGFRETAVFCRASPGDLLHVSVRKGGTLLYEGKMRYGISFGSVKPGEPVLYDGSAEGAACISLNRDHFAERCLPSLCRRGEEFSDYKVSIRRMTE